MAKANQTPTTSRRSVLQGCAALAVAGVAGVPAALGGTSRKLDQLIEEHCAAYKAFVAAIDREQELESAYEAQREEIIVPCLVGGGYSLSQGFDFCEEHIASAYAHQREQLRPLSRVA